MLAQFAGRAYLLAKHAPPSLYTASSADVGRSLTIGLLFDIKVAAIAFRRRCWPAWRSPPSPAAARLAALAVRAGRGDGHAVHRRHGDQRFYYATFARSIDVFVFGLIDEDTSAVLGTVWQGYPVLRAGLLLSRAGGYMVADREMRARLERALPKPRSALACALRLLLIIGITVLACRGSISKFPLNKDDTICPRSRCSTTSRPTASRPLADRDNDKRFAPVTQREGQLLNQRFLAALGTAWNPSWPSRH